VRPNRLLSLAIFFLANPDLATAQARSRDPAREARFWLQIDQARAGSTPCDIVAARLEARLRALSDSALEDFAEEWSVWWDESYNWDLWGTAYLINGGSSDDGFDYFRGWLLTQGSQRWSQVSRAPDTAFDDIPSGTVAECEDIVVVLPNVFEDRFHREAPDLGAHEPYGQPWTEHTLAARFPRLAHKFGAPH
jgi:hypothetical protein